MMKSLLISATEKLGSFFRHLICFLEQQCLKTSSSRCCIAVEASETERVGQKKALTAVGLSHRMNYMTNQISGGQKQRVAIARALVNDPAVIFADEPTGNLDSKSGATVMSILQKLNEEGSTIILVTHDMATAEHATRIVRIKDGRIDSDEKVAKRRKAVKYEEEE
jgi:putative ABC transport system ATP-binding protein